MTSAASSAPADDYESIRVETRARVTTVLMNRPERRNAVDGPMAAELARAFKTFDADPEADVAVLAGAGGNFCAGADLKAVGTARGNTAETTGDGPMGLTRLRLGKPVIPLGRTGLPEETAGAVYLVPVAYVATYPGTEVDTADLLTLCATHLTKIKVPAALHVVDTLPKNPIGKIDKPALRALQPRLPATRRDGV